MRSVETFTERITMDPLFELSHHYYLGDYKEAIKEAGYVNVDEEELQIARDMYLYRSLIAIRRYADAYEGLPDSEEHSLYPWRVLIGYVQSAPEKNDKGKVEYDEIMNTISRWITEENSIHHALVSAIILMMEKSYEDALRVLETALRESETALLCLRLELMSLKVQIMLQMNRLDHAKRAVDEMSRLDEEHILSKLSSIATAANGDKAQIEEADYVLRELRSQFSSTYLISNGLAVCEMRRGKFEEAERDLREALKKDDDNADLLINLYICLQQLGKDITEIKQKVEAIPSTIPWRMMYESCDKEFDAAADAARVH